MNTFSLQPTDSIIEILHKIQSVFHSQNGAKYSELLNVCSKYTSFIIYDLNRHYLKNYLIKAHSSQL